MRFDFFCGERVFPLSEAVRTGLEPATPCVTGMYSNQLNYRTFLPFRLPSLANAVAKVAKILYLQAFRGFFFAGDPIFGGSPMRRRVGAGA